MVTQRVLMVRRRGLRLRQGWSSWPFALPIIFEHFMLRMHSFITYVVKKLKIYQFLYPSPPKKKKKERKKEKICQARF